ncbi:MAG TPA: hypothetical protein VFO52_14105 [Longimicrobiales bacterium]|nr:hypothetical protein [Longimicrobiales bacterium]
MTARRIVLAFLAGFIATFVFHQGGLVLLNQLGLTDRAPFAMSRTEPFGVPQVFSLAFWGGVWGIALAMFLGTRKKGWFTRALIFGALLPSAVALFVVMPLKGMPVAGGWNAQLILGSLILNGLWGVGTALLFRALAR